MFIDENPLNHESYIGIQKVILMSVFKKYYRELLILLGIIIICLTLWSSLRVPCWLFACQVTYVSYPERVINVSRSELEQFPPIIEALANPCRGIHPTEYTKCSNREGMKIVKHFGIQPQNKGGKNYWLHLNIEGEIYQIHIRFENEPPPIV